MLAAAVAATLGLAASCSRGAVLPASAASSRVAPVQMYGAFAAKKDARDPDGPPSFVQTEMRAAAMVLHTKDQAPKEGQQPAQKPVSDWQPKRENYLQFLVDSRHVYAALEDIVNSTPALASFADSGLERSAALDKDIAWFAEEGVATPELQSQGESYAKMLKEMVDAGQTEAFVCHFYNFYFAHTAGGRMIGKRMANMLLDGKTLNFYQWDKGDVDKELLPALRLKIDEMANGWDKDQKKLCLDQTQDSFKYGGAMLQHISPPRE